MSFDRLIEKIVTTQNPTVVGLDPKLSYIPQHILDSAFAEHGETFKGAAEAILVYNKGIIDAICDIVPAVKPQAAFYEAFGWEGFRALYETVRYAKAKGMFVITDGKRNDIGSTMEAYADAHLGTTMVGGAELVPFGADALTVNGYLGTDGISPLMAACERHDAGIFVLVKTSNPSSGELQDKKIDDKPVYEVMGDMCEQWGAPQLSKYGYTPVGAVIGATYPAQLAELRAKLPHTFILVPGYGAQGGGANDVAPAFDKHGLGAIVNSSRAVLTAWQKQSLPGEQYAEAARTEALRMRDDIMGCINKIALPK